MAILEDNCTVTFTNLEKAAFRFKLEESPAFEYGNGTCVIVEEKGCQPFMVDTRYDGRLYKGMGDAEFSMWCSEWLRENYQPILMVERVDDLYAARA